MDKSIQEQIEKLNKISPIQSITSNVETQFGGNGNVITKETMKIEKNGQVVEADIILSFTAGEDNKPFVAYTLENTDDKKDDSNVTVEIDEVVLEENNYYLSAPTQEDYANIVGPAIVAIGNSNLDDPEEVEEKVREEIKDPNFKIISLNSFSKTYEQYYEANEKNKQNVFFRIKSSISALIPVAKLKVIKRIYMKQVDKMFFEATRSNEQELTSEELETLITENDEKYYQVADLKEQFENLPNSEKYSKDIEQLNNSMEELDRARELYVDKLNNEEVQESVWEETNEVEPIEEETLQEPVVDAFNAATVSNPIVSEEPIKLEEGVDSKMEEIVDKNADIQQLADEIAATQENEDTIKLEEDELRVGVESDIELFNEEMVSFKESLVEKYNEKYSRELELTIKSVRTRYEEYIRNLRSKLTDTLDQCLLEANNSINSLKNANDGLKNALATTEKDLKEERKDNALLRSTINEKDKEISDLKNKEQEYDKQNDEQKVEIDSLKKDNQDKDLKISRLESEIRKEKTNNETLNVDLKAKDSKINELTANLEKAEEKNSDYKNQLETMSKNMDDLRTQSEDYRINTQREIEMLNAQLNNYQTFMSKMEKLKQSTNEIASSYAFAATEEGKSK